MNERDQTASSRPFNGGQPLTLIAQAPGWNSLVPAAALHHPAVLCRSAKGTYPVLRLYVCTFDVIRIAVVLGFVNIMSDFQGFLVYPNCLFCRLRRQEEKKGCEDTSRSGRRARRPPAPPAFPSLRENQKALRFSEGPLKR